MEYIYIYIYIYTDRIIYGDVRMYTLIDGERN